MKKGLVILCLIVFSASLWSCKDKRGLAVGKIKKASKLATTEFVIDKVVFGVKRKKLLWVVNLNDAKFVAHSQATIKAGIDLEKLREQDVKIEGKKISLTLPPVQVINFSYPAESFQKDTLISGNAFMNTVTLADQEQFFQEAETDIRNSLKFMDIIPVTERKTSRMLETLLQSLGYEEIYIDFQKGELLPEITPEE
jgi:hypothetical protein